MARHIDFSTETINEIRKRFRKDYGTKNSTPLIMKGIKMKNFLNIPTTENPMEEPNRLSKRGVEIYLNELEPFGEVNEYNCTRLANRHEKVLQAATLLLAELNTQEKYIKRLEAINDKFLGSEI